MEEVRLDRPPPAAAVAPVPDTLGRRFLLFVDTEEEFDWGAPFRREASVAAMAALPEAHRRFAAAGIMPTYLATYPVVDDPSSAAILRRIVEAGEGEVGSQLHPWVTPPFDEPLSQAASFAGNLSPTLEGAKLERLTARIEDAIGVRPRTYRAGRYGVGPATARLLAEAGYRLDVSVRPGFSYAREGGPDFTGFDARPFRVGGLLALPLGVGWTGLARVFGPALHPWLARVPGGEGLASRVGLVARVPLTPEGTGAGEAIRAVDALLGAGVRLLSFSFHSPSLVVGCTPYVRSDEDLARFWRWWDRVLDALARRGVAPLDAGTLVSSLDGSLPAAKRLR